MLHLVHYHTLKQLLHPFIVGLVTTVFVTFQQHQTVQCPQRLINYSGVICVTLELLWRVPETSAEVHPGVESLHWCFLINEQIESPLFMLREQVIVLQGCPQY